MNNLDERKRRYLRDDLSVRLGGLAANLARISSFVSNPDNKESTNSLLEESKHFIEWTASEAEIDETAKLVELQITLACWQRKWDEIWTTEKQRLEIGQKAKEFSNHILVRSGLLKKN